MTTLVQVMKADEKDTAKIVLNEDEAEKKDPPQYDSENRETTFVRYITLEI